MSEEESRFGRYLGYVAAILGILVIVVPAAIWVGDHFGRSDSGSAATAATGPATSTPATDPTTAGAATPPATSTALLTAQPIDTGAENVDPLPRALSTDSSYAGALVMACPSNQTGDRNHTVTYLLHGHYVHFRATLRPYRKTSDESRVQFSFYPDNQPRHSYLVDVNATAAVDFDLDGVQQLTVEIACEDTDAFAIVAGDRLDHA